MKTFVTGTAGFIGFHVAKRLLEAGEAVIGLDNVNDYYDPALKEARLAALRETAARTGAEFVFERASIADTAGVHRIFETHRPEYAINLAAQAGVRYSLENPLAYVEANVTGFTNILEACRRFPVSHLVFASSSSVYGANTKMPFAETDNADHPLQFYAATKRANELMAHSYSHLYDIPATGLRFFTVYGPWGRPDMAPFKFTDAILRGRPIQLYNFGRHSRDFTYIDDIVDGVLAVARKPAEPDPHWNGGDPRPGTSAAPFRVYNIGNAKPVQLADFVAAIEEATGREAKKEFLEAQPGDVENTWADVSALSAAVGYAPKTDMREGVARFVDWFRGYYRL